MKRLYALLFLAALGSALGAQAQTTAAQKPASAVAASPAIGQKIAVIAFQAAVAQTNEFQRDYANLVKKYEPRQQQLKTLNAEVESLTKQLQDGSKLSEAQTTSLTKQLDEKKKRLSRDTEDAESDYKAEVQQMMNATAQKVGQVMTSFAQLRGYTLVVDAGEEESTLVLYATPSTDITQAVIDAYNQESGVAAPAKQTSAQPASQPAKQPIVDAPQPAQQK
jgi:outer membrane protein